MYGISYNWVDKVDTEKNLFKDHSEDYTAKKHSYRSTYDLIYVCNLERWKNARDFRRVIVQPNCLLKIIAILFSTWKFLFRELDIVNPYSILIQIPQKQMGNGGGRKNNEYKK